MAILGTSTAEGLIQCRAGNKATIGSIASFSCPSGAFPRVIGACCGDPDGDSQQVSIDGNAQQPHFRLAPDIPLHPPMAVGPATKLVKMARSRSKRAVIRIRLLP